MASMNFNGSYLFSVISLCGNDIFRSDICRLLKQITTKSSSR